MRLRATLPRYLAGKSRMLVSLCLALAAFTLYSQPESLGGIINEYSAVTSMKVAVSSNPDSVVVADPGIFSVDDIVMLYQPKGFSFDPATGKFTGFYSSVGQYAFLIVDEIIGNTIVFNASTNFLSMADGVASQLIKVADYRDAIVSSTVTAPAWDSATGTGGVVAMYIRGKLTLNAGINVNGKGFKGANPAGDVYGSGCYTDAGSDFKERNYSVAAMDSAGRKGEGAGKSNFIKMRGLGRIINGGGGGNGKYAGGGGGGNYNIGGSGGGQTDNCGPVELEPAGEGGTNFGTTLYNNGGLYPNRIFFGGGGGTGTQDPGHTASAGGNGGGIVVIVADTIAGNGAPGIVANGSSVSSLATGPGGGGGGGGAIVLDANTFTGNVVLSAIGGTGGSTNHTTDYTGPGGGGGGGIYWVRLNQALSPNTSTIPLGGTNITTAANPGTNGTKAVLYTGLEAPLNGFLFNTLPLDDTVCSDVIPPPINASKPKGGLGAGSYTYLWERSLDKAIWSPAPGINTQEDYTFPAPLTETTHFRRIVTSGSITDGEDLWVTFTVLPMITGNVIAAPDTVCLGGVPLQFYTEGALGGANVGIDEIYKWEQNENGNGWTSAGGITEEFSSPALNLTGTWQFRRTVTSHVCVSVSNVVDVTVLSTITDNTITSKDTICNGQLPDLLDGSGLSGGDPSNLWFMWEVAENKVGPYTEVGDAEDFLVPSPPAADQYYTRTIYSGIDSACISHSDTFKIEVLEKISNNLITTLEDTICRESFLVDPFHSSVSPQNGDGTYQFRWEINEDLSGWSTEEIYTSDQPFNRAFPGTSTQVRRVLFSGADDVCKDTSNILSIITIPQIDDNIRISDDTAACQGVVLNEIQFDHPSGGKESSYAFQWQSRSLNGSWSDIPGGTEINYTPLPLDNSTEFRRIVQSRNSRAICIDTSSTTVTVFITPRIQNNTINTEDIGFVCDGQPLLLKGEVPLGGDGTYVYEWQDSTSTQNMQDAGLGNVLDYTEENFTETLYIRRIVSSDGNICRDTSAIETILLRSLPVVNSFTLRDESTDFCETNDTVAFVLEIENSNTDPYPFEYHSVSINFITGTTPGTLDSMSVRDMPATIEHLPQVNVKENITYTLAAVIDNFGCEAVSLPANEIIVTVYDTPDASILMDDVTEFCGDEITLVADASESSDYHFWTAKVLSAGNVTYSFADSELAATTFSLVDRENAYDSIRFIWNMINDAQDCGDKDSTIIVFFKEPGHTDFILKDTMVLFFSEADTLPASTPVSGSGSWSIEKGDWAQLDDLGSGERSSTFSALVSALRLNEEHDFVFTFTNGTCGPYEDDVTVIRSDVGQYKVFSPDPSNPGTIGPNDLFGMRGIEFGRYVSCNIYNSWGVLIQTITRDADLGIDELDDLGTIIDDEGNRIQAIWDGKGRDGELVEDGIYYYKVQVRISMDDEPHLIEGYVILKTR